MKYRVEYHEDAWQRADAMVEVQVISQELGDGRRLMVHLRRFVGARGPGRIAHTGILALLQDRWGRTRWRSTDELHPRDIELVSSLN